MDHLSSLFEHFSLSVRVFYSGHLCGTTGDHAGDQSGHLHILQRGVMRVAEGDGRTVLVDQPSALFYPRPHRHRLQADEKDGADLVCAVVEFEAGLRNPLIASLPELVVVPLSASAELRPTVDLLFAEAFRSKLGRQAAVNSLAEYFFVLLLRAAIDARIVRSGILIGLSDPRFVKAISGIHQDPKHPWTLETLAHAAGMSRARFALKFHEVVGMTPFGYVTEWRLGVAQTLLRKGESLKSVAASVGYATPTALTRVFKKQLGLSPTEWLLKSRSALENG